MLSSSGVTVLMPTRNRVKQFNEARQSALDTASGEIEILAYVDDDDPAMDEYEGVIVGPPMMSAPAFKHLAYLAKHDFIFWGSDDMRWVTQDWDQKLKDKMPEHGLGVVFADDQRGGSLPFFTKKFRDLTGLYPDKFKHFGPDHWIREVAQYAGVEILANDVKLTHRQNKSDETGARERRLDDVNAKGFLTKTEDQRKAIAQKIRDAL